MPKAPLPSDEARRLIALASCNVLDTAPEPAFDAITRLAARICGTPIALVSLVDRDRQWFKSRVGVDIDETPRDYAFCAHAILSDEPMVVPDATADDRVADNPLVVGAPGIRFYAGIPLRLQTGEALGTLCVIDTKPRELSESARQNLEDLTVQATTLLELRRDVSRLERAVDGSSDGLWDHNPTDDTVWYSDPFKGLVGCPPEEYDSFPHVLASWSDLLHPDDYDRVMVAVDAHLTRDETYDIRYRLRLRSGEYRWFRARGKTARDDAGAPQRMSGSLTDVNEICEAEEQLEQKNAELERFVYTASHDLKSPLVTILGYVGHLLRDLEAERTDGLRDYGLRIRTAAERMRANVDDLLELSRIGRAAMRKTAVDLPTLLAHVWEIESGPQSEANLTTSFQVTTVEMDETHATQLLQNLIGNAIKYGCAGTDKRIEVGTAPDGDGRVALFVRDHGSGIEARHRTQAFDLFQRFTVETDGSGVGLAIVKRVAEVNGGRAWIEETSGGGATVWLDLPGVRPTSTTGADQIAPLRRSA